MNTPEENKAVALNWIEASVAGDVDAVRRLFAADCAIFVAGDMPFCGWMDVDAFFNQTMILPLDGEIIFEVGEMVAENELVWFEAQSQATLTNGEAYRNIYIFQMRIRDGLIVEYKEFGDTLHIWRVIDARATRGPSISRQPLFKNVLHRFIGGSIGETQRKDV